MSKRIALACMLIAATLVGQEEKDLPVVRVYDLGPLAARPNRTFYGERPVDASRKDFTLLAGVQPTEESREGDWIPEGDGSFAEVVIELLWTFLGDQKDEGGTGLAYDGGVGLQLVDGGRRLLVRGREADQRIVARVLEQVRAAGDPPVEIDVRHLVIPDGALDEAARAVLRAPAGLDADRLAALARLDVRGGRQGGTLQVELGHWGIFRAVREFRYVPDFDVEVAQAASIADPIPAVSVDGLKAAIRPFLLRDGRLLLRVVASAGDRHDEPRRFPMGASETQDTLRLRNTDYGDIEQCDYRGGAVSTEAVVPLGETACVVLATQTGPEVRWDVLALTVTSAPKPLVSETFAIMPVGALVAPDVVRELRWHGDTGELSLFAEDEPVQRLPLDSIVALLGMGAGREGEFGFGDSRLDGGSLLLRGPASTLRATSESVAALERELVRPARLDVVLSVERPEGGRRTVGVLSAPMTVGRKAALASYLRMDTIGDYDVEIAQEARIADPVPQVATAGAFANAVLSRNPDGTFRLELDLTVAAAPEGIRTSFSRTGGVPLIQTVPLSKCVAPIRLDLAAGVARAVELGPDPFSGGGEGRLVASVSVQAR